MHLEFKRKLYALNNNRKDPFTGAFQLHLFSVPWKVESDWKRAEKMLLQAPEEETRAIAEKARNHLKSLEDRKGIEIPSIEPRVSLEMTEPDQILFRVRVPVASDRISRIEQTILRRFLDSFYPETRHDRSPAHGAGSLAVLVWSADRFVEGSSPAARHFGVPPLLIGMVIVGFGTSAPELLVSSMAAWQNTPGIALGNAYGSNITNIAAHLGCDGPDQSHCLSLPDSSQGVAGPDVSQVPVSSFTGLCGEFIGQLFFFG